MKEQFNISDLVYQVNAEGGQAQNKALALTVEYKEALDKIRHTVSKYHAAELADVVYSPQAGEKLRNLIVRYLTQYRISVSEYDNIAELADKIYEDMAGFGVLSKYLLDPTVEEINVNGWNAMEVIYPDEVVLLPEAFLSPEDCVDKIKKMVWLGGSIIDGSNPIVDSFIGEGVRISAIIPPCTDKRAGGVASIRRQKENVITRELMITCGTATEEELDFLSLCVNHRISLAIAGSTGSGKTTDLAYLISCLDRNQRVYTIEDTRELHIAKFDENNRILSMCVAAHSGVSEHKILEFILEAIPLILFKRQLPDGRRVYDEIFEAEQIENGRVQGRTLYQYDIKKGCHRKLNPPSDKLCTQLLYGGAKQSDIDKFMRGG